MRWIEGGGLDWIGDTLLRLSLEMFSEGIHKHIEGNLFDWHIDTLHVIDSAVDQAS